MINPEVIVLESIIGIIAYYYHEHANITEYNRQLLIALGTFSFIHIIYQLYEYYLELRVKEVCKNDEKCKEKFSTGVTPRNILTLYLMALLSAAIIHIYYEEHRGYAVGITLAALMGIAIEIYLYRKSV